MELIMYSLKQDFFLINGINYFSINGSNYSIHLS